MFGLFSKKKKDEVLEEKISKEDSSKSDSMNLNEQIKWLKENGWVEDYNKNLDTILIMDDREEIISSVIDDLTSLDSSNDFFIDKYNIMTVSTKMAGFHVLDIIKKAPDIEINFALLDIVLGGKKSIDGVRKMIDGVDVSIQLMEKFPSIDILFFSGCIIEDSTDPSHFKNRFDNYTGDDLNNYIMPKDISFDDELEKLSSFFNGF